jgi:hypothetical protein
LLKACPSAAAECLPACVLLLLLLLLLCPHP